MISLLGLAFAMSAPTVRGGEPGLRSNAKPTPESFAGQSVLLLNNGRMVRGYVSRTSGGYLVRLPHGNMVVPQSQVHLQAESRDAVYRELRKLVPPESRGHRLALAGWCATNGLYDQALREIRTVLKTNPDDAAAKRMLRRVEELARPKNETPERKSILERITAPEVTALAGLSPDVAERYVAKVQPILMNNCAQSGCHGPRAKNGFRLSLVHLRGGNRRGISEQNLATTLRYIDLKSPRRSPLLTKPLGNHGRRGRVIFRGSGGAKQLALLRAWTQSLTAEVGGRRLEVRGRKSEGVRGRRGDTHHSPLTTHQLTPAMKAARMRRQTRKTGKSADSQAATPPVDPFDPAEFNRQSAGPPRRRPFRTNRGR